MAQPLIKPATIADLYAIPGHRRFHELLDGEIVEKSAPSGEHGGSQSSLVTAVGGSFQRPPGRGGPGGWWFGTEVDIALSTGDLVRPDVAGWRRDRHAARPTGMPVDARPDWICEVVSTSPNRDRIKKVRIYHRAGIPHYWLVDPAEGSLEVLRWSAEGYLVALTAERGEKVRAEPFDAIELSVGVLVGDDPEE